MVDSLINYISEPIRKSASGFKGKIVSPFKTNTPKKLCMGEERNQANQENKSLKSFLYQKRTENNWG